MVDVSWQGVYRRHYPLSVQLNPISRFAEYNPAFYNPLNAPLAGNAGGKELSDNYFRPLAGLGGITNTQFEGSASYNALQIYVRRNFRRGLLYTFTYTYNKEMGFSSIGPYANISPFFQARNCGASYTGAPQYISASYSYDLPSPSQRLHLRPLGVVTGHWTISGITSWQSHGTAGALFPGFTGTSTLNPAPNFTGSAEGARAIVVGNPDAAFLDNNGNASSSADFTHTFNWKAFAIPQPCSLTNESLACFGSAGGGSTWTLPTWQNNWKCR